MKRVLLANIPPSIAQWLEMRLGAIEAVAAEGEAQLGRVSDDGSWNLSVIQHLDGVYSSRHLLRQLRATPGNRNTPIIYVLDSVPESKLLRELVDHYKVDHVMVHPIEPEALLKEVSRILKLLPAKASTLPDTVTALWKKYRPMIDAQVATLEDVGRQILENSLGHDVRQQAKSAAHQLAGNLGSFGYPHGSELALRLEGMLRDEEHIAAREYADVVVRLRKVLEAEPDSEAPTQRLSRDVLVLDAPNQPLEIPMEERDYGLRRVQHPGQAQRLLSERRPVAILIHLGVEQEHEQRLSFLREASERHPDLPLIAFVPTDQLFSRVEALRNGAQRILDPLMSPQQLGSMIGSLLNSQRKKMPRVLICDDDPVIAKYLELTLHQAGMVTEHIASPATLLDKLHQFLPDVLLVDLELPVMSGLEICRLLRGVPRWQTLPLILMTASKQTDVVVRAFQVGADDFVSKPIVGPEIVARIFNRLERSRHLAEHAATDPVTGLPTWVRGGPRLRSYMHLARRMNRPLAVVVLQVDGSENLAPVDGDPLLAKLGQMLTAHVRGEDTICRYEGDRLLLAFFGMRRSDCVERINLFLTRYQQETGRTFCAGISILGQDSESMEGLVHVASRGLEEASQQGPGHVVAGGRTYAVSGTERSRVDVALVDNDALLGPLLLHALEQKGYSTLWLRDGLEASRRLASSDSTESARLILLEVDLPGASGYALLRQLAAADKLSDTRVLILSARSTQKDILTGLELGATDHVPKPFTLPVLLEKVRRALQP